MKKFFVFVGALLLATSAIARTDDDRVIAYEKLPAEARQMIEQYFAEDRVLLVCEEKEWFGASYEVKLASGCEVKFDSDGLWSEVDCSPQAVPTALIPAVILQKVERDFAGRKVIKIDRDRRDYEVELEGGAELKFDLKGNLIGLDD